MRWKFILCAVNQHGTVTLLFLENAAPTPAMHLAAKRATNGGSLLERVFVKCFEP